MPHYQFYYYVPETHLEETKDAIFAAGAGSIGNYTHCNWQTKGEGQFRPEKGSTPTLGKAGKIEKVIEYKVETICTKENLSRIVTALKASHPYEHPAYGVIKLENF